MRSGFLHKLKLETTSIMDWCGKHDGMYHSFCNHSVISTLLIRIRSPDHECFCLASICNDWPNPTIPTIPNPRIWFRSRTMLIIHVNLVGGLVAMFYFPIYWVAFIIPLDELIFFRGVQTTTDQYWKSSHCELVWTFENHSNNHQPGTIVNLSTPMNWTIGSCPIPSVWSQARRRREETMEDPAAARGFYKEKISGRDRERPWGMGGFHLNGSIPPNHPF